MTIEIKTNNQPRPVINPFELTPKERKEFDYIDWDVVDSGTGSDSYEFFRYKGQVYDLGEFMRCPETAWFKGWDGHHSDSYFSGVLVKYCPDHDHVIIGMYFS